MGSTSDVGRDQMGFSGGRVNAVWDGFGVFNGEDVVTLRQKEMLVYMIGALAVIIGVFFIVGCAPKGPWIMKKENVARMIDRYENEEVICYHLPDDSMQCKWKDKNARTMRYADYDRREWEEKRK